MTATLASRVDWVRTRLGDRSLFVGVNRPTNPEPADPDDQPPAVAGKCLIRGDSGLSRMNLGLDPSSPGPIL